MAAVGEKPRESMTLLTGLNVRQGHRLAAAGGHAVQRRGDIRRKDDDAVAVPRAAPAGWSIAQRLRRAAGDIDSLQLALCEESEVAAVGGPQRDLRALGFRPLVRPPRVGRA